MIYFVNRQIKKHSHKQNHYRLLPLVADHKKALRDCVCVSRSSRWVQMITRIKPESLCASRCAIISLVCLASWPLRSFRWLVYLNEIMQLNCNKQELMRHPWLIFALQLTNLVIIPNESSKFWISDGAKGAHWLTRSSWPWIYSRKLWNSGQKNNGKAMQIRPN